MHACSFVKTPSLFLTAIALLAGCLSPPEAPPASVTDAGPEADTSSALEDGSDDSGPDSGPDSGSPPDPGDLAGTDTPEPPRDSSADAEPDATEPPCRGPLCPCDDSGDCDGAICAPTPEGGSRCAP